MRTIDESGRQEVGGVLRGLRRSRGLSLTDVADRSSVARAAIGSWESGSRAPSGAALDAVLAALSADPGLRSRLLATVAPRYAQEALRATPLGPPIHAGQVLRAMRLRQGTGQSELAALLGVSQGHLARWETGDLGLPADRWSEMCGLLKASAAEMAALASVSLEFEPAELPCAEKTRAKIYGLPFALRPVILLGIEAELWRLATHSEAWYESLCDVVSIRAHASLFNGDLAALRETSHRALALAQRAGCWHAATHAFYADHWRRRSSGARWDEEARRLEGWCGRLHASGNRAWLTHLLALSHAAMGDEDRAVSLTRVSLDMASAVGALHPYSPAVDMAETRLALGEPERALEALGDCSAAPAIHIRIKAIALAGGAVPSDLMEAERRKANGNWLERRNLAELERAVARSKKKRARA